jgi:drug/metabolite transporter (DMT)-like permease
VNTIIQTINLNKKAGQYIILILLALIWGSSFILMKRGLESFSYSQVAALRVFISFVLLLPFAIMRLSRVKKRHIKPLLIVGFIGNAIPAILFTKAQTEVSSSMAGILNALTPLFALLVGLTVYKVKFMWHHMLGVFLGLIGATMLVIIKSGFGINTQIIYPLFIVLATIFYSFSVNEIKQKLYDLDGVTIIAVAFLFVGPLCGIYLLNSNLMDTFNNPLFIKSLIYIFILSLFSSVIAAILFNYLIHHTNALFATSTTNLIPIVAIFWGILDSESILLGQLPAILLILIGIYLVNRKKIIL